MTAFPNASESTKRANPHLFGERKAAELERRPGHATLVPPQDEGKRAGIILVRVTSVRRRLLDPDNICEKYIVDCCRYAGLLPGDSPEQIRLETSQRKATKGEEERTEISITWP